MRSPRVDCVNYITEYGLNVTRRSRRSNAHRNNMIDLVQEKELFSEENNEITTKEDSETHFKSFSHLS